MTSRQGIIPLKMVTPLKLFNLDIHLYIYKASTIMFNMGFTKYLLLVIFTLFFFLSHFHPSCVQLYHLCSIIHTAFPIYATYFLLSPLHWNCSLLFASFFLSMCLSEFLIKKQVCTNICSSINFIDQHHLNFLLL